MIEFDIQDLIPHELMAKFTPEIQQVMIHDIADAARAHWIRLAHQELTTSEQDYVKGILAVQSSPGMAWVTLEGQWPNMVEQGFSSFDMRETLLQAGGKGVQQNASGGLFRSIFMRRGMGNASGRNFTNVTDLYAQALGEERAKAIGKKAIQDVRDRTDTTSSPGGATRWGGRLPAGSGGMPRLRKGELSPAGHPLTADHKTDLMDGAYLFAKKYASGRVHRYTGVFRTISTASPEGWIHPGRAPAGLATKVAEYMGRVAPRMLAAVGSDIPDV